VLLTYKGPLLYANQLLMNLDNGGKGVPSPCFFCAEWHVKIIQHMNSEHEAELLVKFGDRKIIGPMMTLSQFKSHIVRVAWLRQHNFMVWWQQKGVIIPRRCSNAIKEPSKLIFCSYCCILVERSIWDAHCGNCIPIQSMEVKPNLKTNRLLLWEM
jgi:hypothetical protein